MPSAEKNRAASEPYRCAGDGQAEEPPPAAASSTLSGEELGDETAATRPRGHSEGQAPGRSGRATDEQRRFATLTQAIRSTSSYRAEEHE